MSQNFPAIKLGVIGDQIHIDNGYTYLKVAEKRKLDTVTVLGSSIDDMNWSKFCLQSQAKKLSKEEVYKQDELNDSIWHLVFLEKNIDEKSLNTAISLINKCLGENIIIESECISEQGVIKFKTSLLGEFNTSQLIGALNTIDQNIARILSYQGRKFNR